MTTAPADLLTVEQVCEALGISKPTLYKYAREYPRWLKNHRRGRRRVFDADGVRKFQTEIRNLTQL